MCQLAGSQVVCLELVHATQHLNHLMSCADQPPHHRDASVYGAWLARDCPHATMLFSLPQCVYPNRT